MNNRGKLAIAGAAVVVAAGVGSGVAYASDTGGTGSSTSGTATPDQGKSQDKSQDKAQGKQGKHAKKGARHADMARRAVHGEFTVKTKDGYKKVLVQRGTITTDTGSSITVTSPDKYVHTYKIDAKTTHVRVAKAKATADKLAKDQKVFVTTNPKTGEDTAAIVVAAKS